MELKPRFAACLVLSLYAHPVLAADAPSRERELGRRVQLLQQENRELASRMKSLEPLAAQVKEAKDEIGRVRSDAAAAQRRIGTAKKEAAEVRAELAQRTAALDKAAQEVKQLQDQMRELSSKNARSEDEKRQLQATLEIQRRTLGRQGQRVLACREENEKLGALTNDLLKRLKEDPRPRTDAVLGYGDVAIHNEYEAFRSRYDSVRRESAKGQP